MIPVVVGVTGRRGGVGTSSLAWLVHIGSPDSVLIDANIHLPTLSRILTPGMTGVGPDAEQEPIRLRSGWFLPGATDTASLSGLEPRHWIQALQRAEQLGPPLIVLDLPPMPADPCVLTLIRTCGRILCLADSTAPAEAGRALEGILRSVAPDALMDTLHRGATSAHRSVPEVHHGVLEQPFSPAVRRAGSNVAARLAGGEGIRTPTYDPILSTPPDRRGRSGRYLAHWLAFLRTQTSRK